MNIKISVLFRDEHKIYLVLFSDELKHLHDRSEATFDTSVMKQNIFSKLACVHFNSSAMKQNIFSKLACVHFTSSEMNENI